MGNVPLEGELLEQALPSSPREAPPMATARVRDTRGLLPTVPLSLGLATCHPSLLPSPCPMLDPAAPRERAVTLPGVKGMESWGSVPPRAGNHPIPSGDQAREGSHGVTL